MKNTIEVKRLAEEQEIWNEEAEAKKSDKEAKKLVLEWFHKWIYIFGKKASKCMFTRKIWDHAIDLKEIFTSKKKKVYSLSWDEREKLRNFIQE